METRAAVAPCVRGNNKSAVTARQNQVECAGSTRPRVGGSVSVRSTRTCRCCLQQRERIHGRRTGAYADTTCRRQREVTTHVDRTFGKCGASGRSMPRLRRRLGQAGVQCDRVWPGCDRRANAAHDGIGICDAFASARVPNAHHLHRGWQGGRARTALAEFCTIRGAAKAVFAQYVSGYDDASECSRLLNSSPSRHELRASGDTPPARHLRSYRDNSRVALAATVASTYAHEHRQAQQRQA